MISTNWQGRGLASIAVFFWGAAYVWGKIVMAWLPPLMASSARYGFAAIILLILLLIEKKPCLMTLRHNWRSYFLLGFIGITCFQGFLFTALNFTSPINVAIIMALAPIFTAFGESLVTKQIPATRTIIGMIISIVGAALAVLGGEAEGLTALSFNSGDSLAMIAAFCMAFYTVASRRWMRTEVTSLANTTIVITIGAILLLPLALTSLPIPTAPSSASILALIGLAVGSTVIAYLCWTHAIKKIGVSEPNLIFNFMPVVTMLLSSLHGQWPTPEQIIGAALVIGGVTLAMWPGKIRA